MKSCQNQLLQLSLLKWWKSNFWTAKVEANSALVIKHSAFSRMMATQHPYMQLAMRRTAKKTAAMGQKLSTKEIKPPIQNFDKLRREQKANQEDEAKKYPKPPNSHLPHPLPSSSSANEGFHHPVLAFLPAGSSDKIREDLGMDTEIAKEVKEETLLQISTKYGDEAMDLEKKPYKFEDIIGMLETPLMGDWQALLRKGIYAADRTKKYWIDERGNNCFMLYATALQITWINDEQFWCWTTITEGDAAIEVAKLLNVCWLEIHGRLEISYLNPGVTYEVFFNVCREKDGYGWTHPVNLRLKIPHGLTQSYTLNIEDLPKEVWKELKAGEFTADAIQTGEMEFSMFDYKGGLWKRGLLVKGATIRPKMTSGSISLY